MNSINLQKFSLKKMFVFIESPIRFIVFSILCLTLIASFAFNFHQSSAQNAPKTNAVSGIPFRIGERLTYNISFESINNAAYAEIYTVSRGKLGDRDAVELRSKIKTNELVSAFYLVDETRTTYVSSDSGLPLYTRKISNVAVTPKETINNFLVNPTAYNDLLTVIYQARNAGGAGSYSFQEDDRIYNAIFQTSSRIERLKTDAGEFETNVSTVQSDFLLERGITNLRINFSTDTARIPVTIQLRTVKGDFRAMLASNQTIEPEPTVDATPVATPIPRPQATPKPVATPTPYVENEPLSTELPFRIGETLEYQISANGKMLGFVTLQAKERKLFTNQDSLLLTATVTGTQPDQQILKLNDSIRAQVNPLSLAPQQVELKLSGALAAYSQQIFFDQRIGKATNPKTNTTDIPVGTHSVLSLAYAVRSFNLKPSKDKSNPVNDTRVAVFLDTQAYVLMLRPEDAEIINLQGDKVSAQFISISTLNPNIDRYNLRLWLSTDEKRVPLRLVFGNYQADLVTEKNILPR